MKIKQLIYSKYGKILLSVILGIGLASLFNISCNERSCYRYIAPDTNKIEQGIWQYNNQCYKYKTNIKTCNAKEKIMRN
tara:strand:- start:257 stop:493 length:237 start_codon:yes stop_codon:yes gene_type:complete